MGWYDSKTTVKDYYANWSNVTTSGTDYYTYSTRTRPSVEKYVSLFEKYTYIRHKRLEDETVTDDMIMDILKDDT